MLTVLAFDIQWRYVWIHQQMFITISLQEGKLTVINNDHVHYYHVPIPHC